MNSEDIARKMLDQDAFSQWLGIEIIECSEGYCKVGMTIRNEMLNGMQKAHGGITFSLADSCFAFVTNGYGRLSVSIEASINHIQALEKGDYITAESVIDNPTNKLGFSIIKVKKKDELVALFKGVVYRTQKKWD